MNYDELNQFLNENCFIYMDGIMVCGKILEEHDYNLIQALNKLKNKNFKINMNNLKFRRDQVKVLGMKIVWKYNNNTKLNAERNF